MPELRKIETSAAYTPSAGEVVEYLTEEEGKLVLKVKKSDGSEETLSGGSGVDTSDATATAADVPEGLVFYGANGRSIGTMPESVISVGTTKVRVSAGYVDETKTLGLQLGSVSIDGDKVNVSAGYVENATLTVTAGSVSVDGSTVTITEGYVKGGTQAVQSGSVSVDGDTVNVSSGYVEDATLTVPAGSVVVDESINKVVVSEGYVQSDEIDLPGGFQLVKVTNYHPARDGFTAPGKVTVSGLGTVESQWGGDSADFSDVNGEYVVTEDTKYRKGLARVYKQQGGKYYLCGYDPSNMDWAEYSAHWYVSETIGGYGYSAKMSCYSSAEIPNGTANWSNDNIGEFSVTTSVTNETISSLDETSLVQSVTAFDPETTEWTEGGAVAISSYSMTPQTNGIYFAQDGKLIGQHIDRDLNIPTDGLVRRFKAVDGHFVDTIWGTEMLPSGDISYNESGYCGNSAAPLAYGGSHLSASNTFNFGTKTTMNVFFKPHHIVGNALVFGFGAKWSGAADKCVILNSGFGFRGDWSYGIATPILGKWNMYTLSIELIAENKCKTRFYANGKFIAEKEINTYLPNGNGENNEIGIFSRAAIGGGAEYISGQIDDACIWDRILTDEEIADMAKGLEGFDWDIPAKPYVQEQPVLYLSGANGRYAESGQLITGCEESGGMFSGGAIYSYSGDTVYSDMAISTPSEWFGSGDFSLCLDVMPIISRNNATRCPVFNGKNNSPGFFLKQIDGKGEYHPGYYAGTELVCTSESVPLSEWTYIIITCEKGTLRMYKKGVLCMSQSITGSHVPLGINMIVLFTEANYSNGFKGAIRNIRLYNRAITDEEVAELSGVKETE